MKPSVDKFLATTKIYLQIFTGMTEAGNAKDKERTKRHRALPIAILGGSFGQQTYNLAGIVLPVNPRTHEARDRIIISSQAVQF